MENYILDLVEDNNRVIIPNFGAFIISKENGLNILFNNFLSFNDGLLVNYIAEQKGVDTIEATDQVYNYVDKLKEQLDNKGEFKIDKLGVFRKDESGMLRFHQDKDLVLSEEDKSVEPKERKTEEEPALLDIQKESTEQPKEDNKETEQKIEQEVKKEESIKDPVLTIEKQESEEKIESTKASIIPNTIVTKSVNTNTKPTTQKSNTSYSKTVNAVKEKQRKDRNILLIVIGVILAVIGIYFIFFNKPTPPKTLLKPPVAKKIDSTEIKRQNSLKIEQELAAFKADSLRKAEEARMSISNKYHLIVGSFKIKKNAANMAKLLQEKGYSNAQFFENKAKYFVSIDNNRSYGHMENIQQNVLEKEKLGSWIFKMK